MKNIPKLISILCLLICATLLVTVAPDHRDGGHWVGFFMMLVAALMLIFKQES